ncbi:DUF4173 domain-containing protein [Streptomyces sp. NPDC048057]|uniref:DUF4153 domain-containing protein n=1 Tax=Streptomyces sp. NPDC048057 TaxID=3155628 RepID=UPI00340A3279
MPASKGGARPRPATVTGVTLGAALGTGVLSALLLGPGLGTNLLLVAAVATLAAYAAARRAGRRFRPWTCVWAAGGLALLLVPAIRDAGWPAFLAVVAALMAGSLALHGGRTWHGVFLGAVGLLGSLVTGPTWAIEGLRQRMAASRRWGPAARSLGVAALLLFVFGALFSAADAADAAFADLLGALVPEVPVAEGPWRFLLFLLGVAGALAAAHVAAAPTHWDRLAVRRGRPRARWEWALPLIVLDLLFAAFNAVQLAVLFGGYDKVLAETGLTYAEYARQGFWHLVLATLLTLGVIALALRWAPRTDDRDRLVVRSVLGTLCLLTLVVVASALRRMELYVDAYGLTQLRLTVAAMELWLGLVLALIMAAGVYGAAWLPRTVAASAAVGVLAFGLASPDALVAERNADRYQRTGKLDVGYLQELSADAVPALDRLAEPLRSCALEGIAEELEEDAHKPWHATSWGQSRARKILAERPVQPPANCPGLVDPAYGTDDFDSRDAWPDPDQPLP